LEQISLINLAMLFNGFSKSEWELLAAFIDPPKICFKKLRTPLSASEKLFVVPILL
jgi:hypothetical protein